MAKPPKVAEITSLADFSHWLADTVQRAAAREDAGFVQIIRDGESLLTINNGNAEFRCAIAMRVSEDGS